MKKAAKKPGKAKVAMKDLELSRRKGAPADAEKVKGGFAPQPEPPKEMITPIIRSIRPS
jgi:hypothetical protein